MPLKSIVSTLRSVAITSSVQSRSGSSLNRRSGYSSAQPGTFAVRVASDRFAEGQPGLAEGQVERCRFERPAAVLGLAGLEKRERVERVCARERQLAFVGLERLLGAQVVVHLLATTFLAVAVQHDDRALERKLA